MRTNQTRSATRKALAASLLATLSVATQAQTIGDMNRKQDEPIMKPEKTVDPVKTASIDTEKFELGGYYGVLNIEDFNTKPVKGLSAVYHLRDNVIIQAQYGESRASTASFEENADQNFLADDDYDFSYMALNAGYAILNGRSFIGRNRKMETALYVVAGLEQIDFAADSSTGFGFGASYRVVVTDWMTINLDLKNHMFSRDFIGDSKLTNNTEATLGINALF